MLNPKSLGLAGGIIWGLSMFVMTLISMNTGYASAFLTMMEGAYPGYQVSLGGSVIGLVYGFLDSFIGLYILAWLYNKFENLGK